MFNIKFTELSEPLNINYFAHKRICFRFIMPLFYLEYVRILIFAYILCMDFQT
jgi:hypothetical protein